jgi:hypothetical protein
MDTEEAKAWIESNFPNFSMAGMAAKVGWSENDVSNYLNRDLNYNRYTYDDQDYVRRHRDHMTQTQMAVNLGRSRKVIKRITQHLDNKNKRISHFGIWQSADEVRPRPKPIDVIHIDLTIYQNKFEE